jgi:hypothetical protein
MDAIRISINDIPIVRENHAEWGSGGIKISPVGVGTVTSQISDDRWLTLSVESIPASWLHSRGIATAPYRYDIFYRLYEPLLSDFDPDGNEHDMEWIPSNPKAILDRIQCDGMVKISLPDAGGEGGDFWVYEAEAPITTRQLAENFIAKYGGKLATVKRYIQSDIAAGRLTATRLGNQYVISASAASEWMSNPSRGSRAKS